MDSKPVYKFSADERRLSVRIRLVDTMVYVNDNIILDGANPVDPGPEGNDEIQSFCLAILFTVPLLSGGLLLEQAVCRCSAGLPMISFNSSFQGTGMRMAPEFFINGLVS